MKFYFHSIFIGKFNENPMKNYLYENSMKSSFTEFLLVIFIGYSLNFPMKML